MFLLLVPNFPIPDSHATHDYKEELSVSVSGDIAYWSIKLTDVNTTGVTSQNLDNSFGVDSFSLSHYSQQGSFDPRFDIFTTHGFGLINSILPKDGALLVVKASSQENADKFASVLSEELKLGFISYDSRKSNQLMDYQYYSHAEFNLIVGTLWEVFDNENSGFNKLITREIYTSNPNPTLVFSGTKQNNHLVYSLTLGGTSADALIDSTPTDGSVLGLQISLNDLFKVPSINSSGSSSESTISFQSFGSIISSDGISSDSNLLIDTQHDIDNLNSKVIVKLSSDELFNYSLPLVHYPPVLSVVREIDKTAGYNGDTIESRLIFTNLSPKIDGLAIDKVNFQDNWWDEHFTLVQSGGEDVIENLAPGETVTMSRLLKINTDEIITVQSSLEDTSFDYVFSIGEDEYAKTTYSNDFHIELNDVKPALLAFSLYNQSYISMHENSSYSLQVQNLGSRSAYNVDVLLDDDIIETFDSLAPNSLEVINFNISRSDFSFNLDNHIWHVTWSEESDTQKISGNPITIINDYNYYKKPTIDSPNIILDKISLIPIDGIWKDEIEVLITITNNGDKDLSNIKILDIIPDGVVYIDGNLTKNNNLLESTIKSLRPGNTTVFSYNVGSSSSSNILLTPASAIFSYSDREYEFISQSIVLPTAISIHKDIDENSALVGYNFTISVDFHNNGDLFLYNVQVRGNDEQFLNEEGSDWNERSSLKQQGSMNYNYQISNREHVERNLLQAYADFVIGGKTVRIFSSQIPIEIINSPVITITTIPSEILDNQEVELIITIENPSTFTIKSLSITPGINDNLEILDQSIFVDIPLLNPEDSTELRTKALGISPGKSIVFQPIISHEHKNQLIDVQFDEFSVFVSEEITNRYIPSLILSIVILFGTVYFVNRLSNNKQ